MQGTQVRAHKVVLAWRAALFQLASIESTEISGISLKLFRDLINYAYSGDVPIGYDDLEAVLSLLKASNRFACTDLKMELEVNGVEKFLDKGNAIKLLLFADSHSCALLTESATKLICRNGAEIMASLDWKLMMESPDVQSILLRHMFSSSSCSLDRVATSRYDRADVSSLRKRLTAEGKDVDGTREILVRRCKKLRKRWSPRSLALSLIHI